MVDCADWNGLVLCRAPVVVVGTGMEAGGKVTSVVWYTGWVRYGLTVAILLSSGDAGEP